MIPSCCTDGGQTDGRARFILWLIRTARPHNYSIIRRCYCMVCDNCYMAIAVARLCRLKIWWWLEGQNGGEWGHQRLV